MKTLQRKNLNRIYHPYWNWECYKNGFFDTTAPNGMTPEQAKLSYAEFLSDLNLFSSCIYKVFTDWPHSTEHWLTNSNINRIAWLGQSAMCYHTKVPAVFRSGFKILTEDQQRAADAVAESFLEMWLNGHER